MQHKVILNRKKQKRCENAAGEDGVFCNLSNTLLPALVTLECIFGNITKMLGL